MTALEKLQQIFILTQLMDKIYSEDMPLDMYPSHLAIGFDQLQGNGCSEELEISRMNRWSSRVECKPRPISRPTSYM